MKTITQEIKRNDARAEAILAHLLPNTTLLEPTEWYLNATTGSTVDPYRTRLNSVGRLDRPVQVLRKHRSSKTVQRVVRLSYHVVLVLEFDHDTDRSEYLFSHNLHVWGSVREDGGLNKIPFGS